MLNVFISYRYAHESRTNMKKNERKKKKKRATRKDNKETSLVIDR